MIHVRFSADSASELADALDTLVTRGIVVDIRGSELDTQTPTATRSGPPRLQLVADETTHDLPRASHSGTQTTPRSRYA